MKLLRLILLRENQLKGLPESLSELTNLTLLDLSNNSLTLLPPWLANFTELQWLYVQNNRLKDVPDDLGKIKSLTMLFLYGNELTWLPHSIGQLRNLTELCVQQNYLTSLPKSLGDLTNLRHLDFHQNQLTSLPASLGKLVNLMELDAHQNRLFSMPDSIGDLVNLWRISLEGNRLTSLPKSFGKMQMLEWADLTNNLLTSLPETFCELTNLKSLFLQENQLTHLPDRVGNLKSLSLISLKRNKLTCLPQSFGELSELKWLLLQHNRLKHLPETMGNLRNLTQLHLMRNALTSLPDSFGELQQLEFLGLENNRLTSLLGTVGKLKKLRHLFLQSNQLSKLPESIGNLTNLWELSLQKNKLTALPTSLGNLRKLVRLYAQKNLLRSWPDTLQRLRSVTFVLLHDNALRGNLTVLCHWREIRTIYLHNNKLETNIPDCIGGLPSLQVLTLHDNMLLGPIPFAVGAMSNLQVLTLHENALTGSIPKSFSSSPKLSFLSAFGNDLSGCVPELNLKTGCVDDFSFEFHKQTYYLSDLTITCDTSYDLHDFNLSLQEMRLILESCPSAYNHGNCSTASSRGPVLLLQSNRFSCSLPTRVTSEAASLAGLRSLILMGNMLGNGTKGLPDWIHDTENQPFLYVSSSRGQKALTMLVSSGAIFAAALYSFNNCSGFFLGLQNQKDQTGKAHVFVMRMSVQFLPIYSLLLALYLGGASYYRCGDTLGDSSLAHFSGGLEFVLALGWSAWILLGMRCLRDVPKPPGSPTPPASWLSTISIGARKESAQSRLGKMCWFSLWLFLVLLFSTPSMAYAMVDSLPQQNTLITSPKLLTTIHSLAVPIMLLVDMLLTPKVAALISERSALRRSVLLMAARAATMWLNATLCTIYLSEHCMRGWTQFWTVCNPLTEHYQNLNISLGEHQLLDPTNDLCLQNEYWWRSDACVRSIVETLGPLFVTKMIQRAFLQPVIVLVLWKLSKEIEGQLWLFPLACFGIRSVKFCTSNSLDRAQQASFLVTLAEVLLLWSPLVPLLIPVVFMATWSNLIVFRMAKSKFNAKVPDLEDGETASMSRKYMHFSLGVLLIFQIWFALTSRMRGTSLVILAAVVYVCDSFSLTEQMSRGLRKFRDGRRISFERDNGVQMVELRLQGPGPSGEVFGA